MKKLLILPAIALMLGVAFSSCKKDESTADIAGTYKGELVVLPIGQSAADTIKNVDLIMVKDDSGWKLKLNKTITIVGPVGPVELPLDVTCPVSTSDANGKTHLQGGTDVVFATPIPNPMVPGGPTIPGISVTVSGDIDAAGNAVINIRAMNGALTVEFTGKK